MICYKDRTFCGSKVEKHTCGREFTAQDAVDARKWWGGDDYPVAYGEFCKHENVCVQCGESKEAIKRKKLLCATMSHTEAGSEVDQEFDRHRFKPYSQKELDAIARDEAEYIKQMGEMADFVNNITVDVTFTGTEAKPIETQDMIKAIETLRAYPITEDSVDHVLHNCEKEKFIKALNLIDSAPLESSIPSYYGMPVHKKSYVPLDEIWLMNSQGKVIQKFKI